MEKQIGCLHRGESGFAPLANLDKTFIAGVIFEQSDEGGGRELGPEVEVMLSLALADADA